MLATSNSVILSFNDEVWALDTNTGVIQWESHDFRDIILQTALAMDYNILFIVGSSNIAAMDASTLFDYRNRNQLY